MQCREVVELLSAYYDNELSQSLSVPITEHLQSCPRCLAELESFRRMSELTSQLDEPTPGRTEWSQLEATLDADAKLRPLSGARVVAWSRMIAVAAVLALCGAWGILWRWDVVQHKQLVLNFNEFLDTFDEAPEVAQAKLSDRYSGRVVTLAEAAKELKYSPAVAGGLSADYEFDKAYLLKMPCCQCVEACYRRREGGEICVFEHGKDHPVEFGDRPCSFHECCGNPTCVARCRKTLAASWLRASRLILVVGAKDVAEVSDLAAQLGLSNSDRSQESRVPVKN